MISEQSFHPKFKWIVLGQPNVLALMTNIQHSSCAARRQVFLYNKIFFSFQQCVEKIIWCVKYNCLTQSKSWEISSVSLSRLFLIFTPHTFPLSFLFSFLFLHTSQTYHTKIFLHRGILGKPREVLASLKGKSSVSKL